MEQKQPSRKKMSDQPMPPSLQIHVLQASTSGYNQPQIQPSQYYQCVNVTENIAHMRQYQHQSQQIQQFQMQHIQQQQTQQIQQQQQQIQRQQQQPQQVQRQQQQPQQIQQQQQQQRHQIQQQLQQQHQQQPQPQRQLQLQQQPQPQHQQLQPQQHNQSQLRFLLQQEQPQHRLQQANHPVIIKRELVQKIVYPTPRPKIQHECKDERMTLEMWSQTEENDFPCPPSRAYQRNEAILLGQIRELKETLRNQTAFMNQLAEEHRRATTPSRAVPTSTTISPPTIQPDGGQYPVAELELQLDLNNEAIPIDLNFSHDSDRLEMFLSDESDAGPEPLNGNNFAYAQRPDLENAVVSIGPNGTKIPAYKFERMTWTSATLATWKLLNSLFDREVLATHSITGKVSAAYQDFHIPIIGQLDPSAVQDVIFAVSTKCRVPEIAVEAMIWSACANENQKHMIKNPDELKKSTRLELNKMNEGA